jgi:hypothetical protein
VGCEAGELTQLCTSTATFSADGAGSFRIRESPHENNAQCVLGPEPWLELSALTILSWALLPLCLSATQILTLCFRENASNPAGTSTELTVVHGSAHNVKEEKGIPLAHPAHVLKKS